MGCASLRSITPVSSSDPLKTKNPYLLMMYARYAQNQGDAETALNFYSQINDPYAWLQQARIFYVKNDTDNALALIEKVINEGTYSNEALELRARIYAERDEWVLAIKDIEKVLSNQPDNKELAVFLANIKMYLGDFKGARSILEKTLESYKDDNVILYALSKACIGGGDLISARNYLVELIKVWPDFSPAYEDLGRVYQLLGDSSSAEQTYLEALKMNPVSSVAILGLSDIYASQDKYGDALKLLQRLNNENPSQEVLYRLVLLEIHEGMYEEALKILKDQDTLADEDYYYIALAHAGLSQWDKALQALDKITVQDGFLCDVILLKASIFEDMGKPEDSIKILKEGLVYSEKSETCREIIYRLTNMLEESGKREEGLAVAQDALKKYPHDPHLLNFVGYIWADMGKNLNEARGLIEEALSLKPDDGFIIDSMAWVLYKLGLFQESLTYMERALQKTGDDPIINEHMGDVLFSLGQKEKALEYYLKASQLNEQENLSLKQKIDNLQKQGGSDTLK
jgi:tetratricopeptide (TPR) repeat protein